MNNYLWLVVVPNLASFFETLGILGVVSCIVGGVFYTAEKLTACGKEEHKEAGKLAKNTMKLFSVSMTLLFIVCFIPNKKDVIQLKAISMVSELKGSDQIPQKIVTRLNKLLDEEDEI